MKKISKLCLFIVLLYSEMLSINSQDPFAILGIPSLNPSQMFRDESLYTSRQNPSGVPANKKIMTPTPTSAFQTIKSIDDLPAFLQSSNLNEEEGMKIISKFLIADDFLLKKNGAIYDQSGFDGLMNNEAAYPQGTKERPLQRARSAAKIFVKY